MISIRFYITLLLLFSLFISAFLTLKIIDGFENRHFVERSEFEANLVKEILGKTVGQQVADSSAGLPMADAYDNAIRDLSPLEKNHLKFHILWFDRRYSPESFRSDSFGKQLQSLGKLLPSAYQAEVLEALPSVFETGSTAQFSGDAAQHKFFVSLQPVFQDMEILGVLLLSAHSHPQSTNADKFKRLAVIGILGLILVWILQQVFSRQISRYIGQINRKAEKFLKTKEKIEPVLSDHSVKELTRLAKNVEELMAVWITDNQFLSLILANMADGLIIIDRASTVVSVNQGFLKICEMMRLRVSEGDNISANKDFAFLLEKIDQSIQIKQQVDFEHSVFSQDNKDRYFFSFTITQLESIDHENVSIVVVRDITRQRKLERVRSDFVSDVSHELKTPLTSIIAASDVLAGEVEKLGDPGVVGLLETIERQSDRLNSIINELLMLNKLEYQEGIQVDQFQVDSLFPLVQQVVDNHVDLAKQKNIDVVSSVSRHDRGWFNFSLLEIALNNLVSNAIKYSRENSVVGLGCHESGDFIGIYVKDHGIGINPKYHSRIWQRFYRVDKSRSRDSGGTGLGLAIVKHIVISHGGTCHLESEPGVGSKFLIYLRKHPK